MKPSPHRTAAFSIVDVMMGATILVVGLMGLIQALTIGSEMLATARRQTLAAQILDHHVEQLRFLPWDDPLSTDDIVALPAGPATVTIDAQFRPAWNSATAYAAGDAVTQNGAWYYCTAANTNRAVTNGSFWRLATAEEVGIMTDANVAQGATFALTRTVSGSGNQRVITFTLTWSVKPSGFSTSRTFTRIKSATIAKYGLSQSVQRS